MNNHRKINCKVKEKVKLVTFGYRTFDFGGISSFCFVSEKLV